MRSSVCINIKNFMASEVLISVVKYNNIARHVPYPKNSPELYIRRNVATNL